MTGATSGVAPFSDPADACAPWVAVAGLAAAGLLATTAADASALATGFAAAGATAASLFGPRALPGSARVVAITAAFVAIALLVPVGWRGGGGLPLVGLAVVVQLTVALMLPRRLAFGAAVAVVAAAAGGRALAGSPEATQLGAALLVTGGAVVGAVARLLDAHAELARWSERARQDKRPGNVGATRVELERVKGELSQLASQLKREASIRRRAEERALEALRTKDAFLAVMSHELRTPLNQIIGYSEILLEDADTGDQEQVLQDVERIHVASMNLFEIISNVLDLSRIEAGKMTIVSEEVPVAEFVEGLVQSFAAQARRRGNTLRVRCPTDIGALSTDRTKLRTILGNLLSNACKFTDEGTIRIAVEVDRSSEVPIYVFEVSDTGIGIHPEHIERLFQPFVQADGSPTRRHDGSGLGLAISRHFCAMLGGDISVESALGKGSLFRVRIPREFVDPRRAGIIVNSIGV